MERNQDKPPTHMHVHTRANIYAFLFMLPRTRLSHRLHLPFKLSCVGLCCGLSNELQYALIWLYVQFFLLPLAPAVFEATKSFAFFIISWNIGGAGLK